MFKNGDLMISSYRLLEVAGVGTSPRLAVDEVGWVSGIGNASLDVTLVFIVGKRGVGVQDGGCCSFSTTTTLNGEIGVGALVVGAAGFNTNDCTRGNVVDIIVVPRSMFLVSICNCSNK